jgi:hypothetical protein
MQEGKPKKPLGFNAFKLAPSNFKEWHSDVNNEADLLAQLEYHIYSTKPDSQAHSMVYELLLKMALPITTPIECIQLGGSDLGDEKKFIYIAKPADGKSVALFFDPACEETTKFILKYSPAKVVCLNKCFEDSQALTNFSLQLQDANIALDIL